MFNESHIQYTQYIKNTYLKNDDSLLYTPTRENHVAITQP